MGVQARDLLGKAVAGEQLGAPGAAAGGIGAPGRTASPRHAFHLAPHPHERIEACHRLGHKGNAAPALGGQGRRVLGRPSNQMRPRTSALDSNRPSTASARSVLPEPEAPTTATISPSCTERLRERMTSTSRWGASK